ncbi:MAG: hypothetical protein OQK52_11210, partial [Ignavibacteriaceae bacterium]|nr:hypothetical protein [Ignavibacteriaceae bacterium]
QTNSAITITDVLLFSLIAFCIKNVISTNICCFDNKICAPVKKEYISKDEARSSNVDPNLTESG